MENIEEQSLNKTPQEIDSMYSILLQSIRNYISRILSDNKATEDNPLECHISLDYGAVGLSTLQMPTVQWMFQDSEGIIWCIVDWNDEPVDFSELYTDDQIIIVKNII